MTSNCRDQTRCRCFSVPYTFSLTFNHRDCFDLFCYHVRLRKVVKTDGKDAKDSEKKEKSPDNKTRPPPPEAQYLQYLVLRPRIFSLHDSVALCSVGHKRRRRLRRLGTMLPEAIQSGNTLIAPSIYSSSA